MVKVYEKDSLLQYDNLLEGLKNPKTNWIIVKEKIEVNDSIAEMLTTHKNLIQIDFSPLQNPSLIPLIGKIPNLMAYNLLLPRRSSSYGIPNIQNSNLKALLHYKPDTYKSWTDVYTGDTLISIFKDIEYVNIQNSATNNVTFDSYLFPNLEYIDFSLYPLHPKEWLKEINYQPYVYNIFPFNQENSKENLRGFRFINQHFFGIPSKRLALDLCGAPNLIYLGFIDCTLPKKLYLCEMPLQTLIFKKTVIPKIEDSDTILTLKNLFVESSNKSFRNLKAHKKFPNLIKLSVKNYGNSSAYVLGIDFYKKKKIGINSKKLSKLNQLTHYELYGVKDRSFGFKLPKEKNNLTTLKIEKSGLWWPPKNLEEYKNLDTLVLEVAFLRQKRLKKALLNLPNLKYVVVSKSLISGRTHHNTKATMRKKKGEGLYTKLEWEIKEDHPNKSLYIHIESKEYPLYYKNSPELESK